MRPTRLLSTNATSQLGPQFAVLRLRSWPDLSPVSDSLIPDVIRICALLAVRPTGAPLIHRLVDIPRDRVQHVVDMLHLHGHLSNGAPDSTEKQEQKTATDTPLESSTENEISSSLTGFLDRFLRKLRTTGAH